MLGIFAEPQHIRLIRSEAPLHQVVMDRRPGLAISAAPGFAEHAPPPVGRADPARGPPRHHLTRGSGFVGEEAVPELRVVTMSIEQGRGPIGLGDLAGGDRCGQPPVIGLASELEHPVRHHHGHPVGGELLHERV
jgi:hypothetical protein